MKLKKYIAGMGAAAVLGLTPYAGAIDVGEPMPDLTEQRMVKYGGWVGGSKKGITLHYHNKHNECSYDAAHLICPDGAREHPFGVFDIKTKKLYLDNAPNDGIVDDIVELKEGDTRSISSDAPDCPKKGI